MVIGQSPCLISNLKFQISITNNQLPTIYCDFLRFDCQFNVTVFVKRTYTQKRCLSLPTRGTAIPGRRRASLAVFSRAPKLVPQSFLHYNLRKLIRNSNFLLLLTLQPLLLYQIQNHPDDSGLLFALQGDYPYIAEPSLVTVLL